MHTSSFEHIIRIQFNALMMTVIKCTVKSRNRQFARHSKRETEYYGTAEPPVRCGESHLSGLTEPPHFVY